MTPRGHLQIIGLHTVFEHHAVMGADALAAFVHEYRLRFAIGIDTPGTGAIPQTMQAYELGGTPSVVLIDRAGRVRLNQFGQIDDMALGALIGELIAERGARSAVAAHPTPARADPSCDDGACRV